MTVKRYTPTQCCEHDCTYVTYSDYQNLVAENAELKSRTVTVPKKAYLRDMRCNVVRWSQVIDALSDAGIAFVRDDGELIAGARETPATDAAIAEIESVGAEKMFNLVEPAVRNFCNPVVTGFVIEELESLAANLRAGRKG